MPLRSLFHLCCLLACLLPGTTSATTIIAGQGGGTAGMTLSLPALALAAATEVDYIQLQLVATKDDQLIVFESPTLGETTDVAQVFADRKRQDGKYYALDLTLAEIRQLRRNPDQQGRIPAPSLGIATFRETLSLVRQLEKDLNKAIGIAPEIIDPQWHLAAEKDISQLVISELQKFNYLSKADKVLLLCGDGDELLRIHKELLPAQKMELHLVQMIGPEPAEGTAEEVRVPEASEWAFTRLGVKVLSGYVTAIALHSSRLIDKDGKPKQNDYLASAHGLNLQILVFPLDNNPANIPSFAKDYPALLDFYTKTIGVDGIISTAVTASVNHLKAPAASPTEATTPGDQANPPSAPVLPVSPTSNVPPTTGVLHSSGNQ